MNAIERLSWDSDFFQINIGRAYISKEQYLFPQEFIREAKSKYDLVYVFSDQILQDDVLKEANLDLMDIMITMSQQPKIRNNKHNAQLTNVFSEKELDECYEIAGQTAEVSRFYNEPLIGKEKAKKLYRKWIDNAINQQYADGILVVKSENTITGIHVVKTLKSENSGLCSLIGVNNNFKGHGIGRNLWDMAFEYWSQFDFVKKYKVPFSIKNSESFNFHLKMGFSKVEEIKYIYHFRNNN